MSRHLRPLWFPRSRLPGCPRSLLGVLELPPTPGAPALELLSCALVSGSLVIRLRQRRMGVADRGHGDRRRQRASQPNPGLWRSGRAFLGVSALAVSFVHA
jgi:hypothetical protein